MDDQLPLPGMDAPAAPAGPREIDLSLPPRLRLVDRSQARFMPCSLDATLPPDHDARLVWDFVLSLPMKVFEDTIAARGSAPGRAATDPRILLPLWIYAGIFAWRQRMQTQEAKTIYKQRGSTIKTINGDLTEHRGLRRLRVRGPTKVRCVVLLLALVYNLLQFETVLIAALCAKKS